LGRNQLDAVLALFSDVVLRHCFIASLLYCVTVLLRHCCTASLLYCVTVVLHHCCIASLLYCITVLLRHCCIASLLYCVTATPHGPNFACLHIKDDSRHDYDSITLTVQKNCVLFDQKQRDQIGRIFNYLLIDCEQFFENYRISPIFWNTFSLGKSYICIIFDKKRVGLHLGDFFTNSSGHPDQK
jgi:hypothetical protein